MPFTIQTIRALTDDQLKELIIACLQEQRRRLSIMRTKLLGLQNDT